MEAQNGSWVHEITYLRISITAELIDIVTAAEAMD